MLNAAAIYLRVGDYGEAERAARYVLANKGGQEAQRLLAQALIMQGWQANMAGDTSAGRRLLNAGFAVDAPPRWLIYDLQTGSAPMQEAAKAYRWRIQLNILLKDAAALWQRITA
ncbi:hypothetical protein IP84_10375 [beta proteobacterium AAP99]|nr:hypothetical protein IP84_10375 [beta proteobacterium AAP99]